MQDYRRALALDKAPNAMAHDVSTGQVPMPRFGKLLTPQEVARQLDVSVDWVQAHATRKEPRIDHIRVGKLIRFTPEHVAEFVRRHAVRHKN